jgi:hypothetical protein
LPAGPRALPLGAAAERARRAARQAGLAQARAGAEALRAEAAARGEEAQRARDALAAAQVARPPRRSPRWDEGASWICTFSNMYLFYIIYIYILY